MSFKAFVSSTAIAGTLLTGALVVSAPAEAATIMAGSSISFAPTSALFTESGVRLTGNTLDFFSPGFGQVNSPSRQRINITNGDGSFEDSSGIASLIAPIPRIKDISLIASILNPGKLELAGTLTDFLTGINIRTGPGPFVINNENVDFDLTYFLFDPTNGEALLRGIFKTASGNSALATGRFTSQLELQNPTSYSFTLDTEPIPTPALLPGLISMGIAVLRRKKEEAEENA